MKNEIYIVRLVRSQEVMIEDPYPTQIVIMSAIQQTVVVSNGGFILMAQDGTRTTLFVLFVKVYFIKKLRHIQQSATVWEFNSLI